MSIYQLKTAFQNQLRPLCQRIAKQGITANQVTLFAVIISALSGLSILLNPQATWPLLLLPVVLFIRMGLNAIDGMLAREHDMQSHLGAILNEMGDVVSDTVLYLPFALLPFVNPHLMVAVVILAIFTEMIGIIGIQIGASRRYDGPMGKSDRAFVFGTLALFIGLGWLNTPWMMNSILFIVLALLLITIINRAKKALNEI